MYDTVVVIVSLLFGAVLLIGIVRLNRSARERNTHMADRALDRAWNEPGVWDD